MRSILKGVQLCLFDREIRRLAVRPWVIGLVAYLVLSVGAVFAHGPLVELFLPQGGGQSDGITSSVASGLLWFAVALGLMGSVAVASFLVVLVIGGVYTGEIARAILRRNGTELPGEGALAGAWRSAATELVKLLYLIPLGTCLFFIGLIPFLSPFALVGGAWLLGFASYDVVLDVLHMRAGRRFRFARRFGIDVLLLGSTMVIAGAIPFLPAVLFPVTVAAAASRFVASGPMQRFSEH